jgi:hypothetical protein
MSDIEKHRSLAHWDKHKFSKHIVLSLETIIELSDPKNPIQRIEPLSLLIFRGPCIYASHGGMTPALLRLDAGR